MKSRAGPWFSWLSEFSVESLFSRKRQPGPPRTIYVNNPLPADCLDSKGKVKPGCTYATNQVITSKYTIITFLPRNLMEQFRRVANMFFLGIAITQFFPKFSTIAAGVAILPLLVILGITALKDGYEDFKRHQSDKQINYGKVRVLTGGNFKNPNLTEAKSKTFIRGILPQNKAKEPSHHGEKHNHPTEPDIDIDYDHYDMKGTEGQQKPYWKTTLWEDVKVGDFVKIMDKESFPADILICATSEDGNVAFVETMNLDGETNLKSRSGVPALTHLRNARECANSQDSIVIKCDRPDTDMYRLNANVTIKNETSPVDLSMTFLRGTVLKNTDWAIGIVLFTGLDSKIVMNSGGTPSKRSKVERQMNPQVISNLVILAVLATVCAIVDSALEEHYYPLGAPWLFGDNHSDDNPKINGLITFIFALLTFQDIVPISLYISIEFVRTCQAAFIYLDGDIYYKKTNRPTIPRSWNLSDDLGQIEYIFSDKTGTLTQNLMVFRQCSIGGQAYCGDPEFPSETDDIKQVPIKPDQEPIAINIWPAKTQSPPSTSSRIDVNSDTKSQNSEIVHFKDSNLQRDLEEAAIVDPNSSQALHARLLNGFFTVLGLCHTVLVAHNPVTGEIEYRAQSPDEAALVQAAADVGYVFLGREKDILSLQTPFSMDVERYQLLNILEFTSARKRMSVVLRKLDEGDNRLFLLTKGADNVIFERLQGDTNGLRAETEKHLNEFANNGLRTLTLAYKVLKEEDYQEWSRRYHQATIAMENREEAIERVSNELEQDLRLLGATAIEDRLQDGVPETIADLKRAGIKIWVATGDKLETAVAIGRSTNLIQTDSNIIIVRGGPRPVNEQIKAAIQKFFPEVEDIPAINKGAGSARSSMESRDRNRLHRMSTDVSSIVGSHNGDRPGGFVLVVDGAALLEAFADEENKSLLLHLATLCEGVICCRVSPMQKALIVKLVKDGLGSMTLAIGDGANDVSMIQAADVGIGISGEEGLQAVNSSDYAIAQFRFLKKLLLVHGHWSYARNGTMILNFFYKNMVPTGILWWFQIYDGWSANFVFDYIYVLFWNSLWTIAAVIGIGLFDRILDAEVLMQLPELYHFGREGHWFGLKHFFVYIIDGIVQSVIIFFLILYTYTSTSARSDGFDTRLQQFSTTMAISGVMVANTFTGLSATAWTYWLCFFVFIGTVVVWIFTIIYALIAPGYAVTNLYGNDELVLGSAYFWFGLVITFVVSLAPRIIAKAYKVGFRPDDLDIVRYIKKQNPNQDLSQYSASSGDGIGLTALKRRLPMNRSSISIDPGNRIPSVVDLRSASRTDMSTGIVSRERGFDFITEERGVEMRRIQSNISERRPTHTLRSSPKRKGKEVLSHIFSVRKRKSSL